MSQEGLKGVNRASIERLLGTGFSGSARGWFLRADDIFARLARGLIAKEHRCKGLAHVPFEVVGDNAQKGVRARAALQTVMDGAHLEIDGFDTAEGLFNAA